MRAVNVTSYFYICKFHKNVGSYVDTLILLSLILSYFKYMERSYLICKVYAFLKNHYAYSYDTHIILIVFVFKIFVSFLPSNNTSSFLLSFTFKYPFDINFNIV